MKKLLVLPLYNLADRVEDILPRAMAAVDDSDTVLLIDDGSTDNTAELVNADVCEKIFYFRHECELGFGGVMISAFDFAKKGGYECVIVADSRSSNFSLIVELCSRAIEEGYEIVNISRNMRKNEQNSEYAVFSTGTFLSKRINDYTGLDLSDIFSPYKAFLVDKIDEMTLEEFDESWILQLWIQSAYFKKRTIEVFCAALSDEYTEESEILEKDPEHYNNFVSGEMLLYPVKNETSEE